MLTISSLLSAICMHFAAGIFSASLQVCDTVENIRNSSVTKLVTVPSLLLQRNPTVSIGAWLVAISETCLTCETRPGEGDDYLQTPPLIEHV